MADFNRPGYIHEFTGKARNLADPANFATPAKLPVVDLGLKKSFSSAAEPDSKYDPSAKSLLEVMAPDLKSEVKGANLDQYYINPKQETPSVSKTALAGDYDPKVQNTGQQIELTKGQISTSIEKAQQEILTGIQEMRQTGLIHAEAHEIFPNMAKTSNDAAQGLSIVAGSAMGGINGAGTLVTAMNAATNIGTMIEDLRSGMKNPKQLQAMVQDYMVQKQTNQQAQPSMNVITGQTPRQTAQQPLAVDYVALAKSQYGLDDIMSLDPDNPNPKLVPEWERAKGQEIKFDAADNSISYLLDGNAPKGDIGEINHALKTGGLEQVEEAAGAKILIRADLDESSGFVPTLKGFLKINPEVMAGLSNNVLGVKPAVERDAETRLQLRPPVPAAPSSDPTGSFLM